MSPDDKPWIDILLATYNGETRLPRQLASLEAQTHRNWRLIARDDGSKDGTVRVLAEFGQRHPGRVAILGDNLGNVRTLRNFALLLAASASPYCGFCDQDDIWLPEKLATALAAMRELEAGQDPATPALVVTDRRVVDEHGRVITPSFWRNQGIHPRNVRDFLSFTAHPVAAGSSMLLNAPLRRLAQPIPDAAMMHDTWIELVAARFARTRYIEIALVEYTRHAENVSGGGRAYPASSYLRRAGYVLKNRARQRNVYRRYLAQARAFLGHHGAALTPRERRRTEDLLAMQGAPLPRKLWLACRCRALPPTWERKLAFLLLA
jgi:glycosyltransferase involved in cell wall biosynthesis